MSTPRRLGPPELVPPSVLGMGLSRRGLLRSAALGTGLVGASGFLSACGGDSGGGGGGGGGGSSSVAFGMNEAGDIPPAQRLRAMAEAFTAKTDTQVERNEVEHNTFQENINTYLQGNPDDVFTWFAGFRMDQFAEQGLITDISDVWPIDGVGESFKEASTASDGKQYFVPREYYPWALF